MPTLPNLYSTDVSVSQLTIDGLGVNWLTTDQLTVDGVSYSSTIGGINQDIATINQTLVTVGTDISNLYASVNNLDEGLENLLGRVGTAEVDIDNLETDVAALTLSISNVETDLTALETKTQNQTAVAATTTFSGTVNCTTGYAVSGVQVLTGTTLTVTNVGGTLTTASQPNITSVGTLTNLTVGGSITQTSGTASLGALTVPSVNCSGNVSGTLTTASQPNVTSVGTLTGLTVGGSVTQTSGTASLGALTVPSVSCSGNISGTLTTASQPNVTSVGTLTGLTVGGSVTQTSGTASLGALTVPSISCSGNISGTLTTANQPNITTVGNLTTLNVGSVPNQNYLELNSGTNVAFVDFHSLTSGGNDYDSRIISSGGEIGNTGQADLQLQAKKVLVVVNQKLEVQGGLSVSTTSTLTDTVTLGNARIIIPTQFESADRQLFVGNSIVYTTGYGGSAISNSTYCGPYTVLKGWSTVGNDAGFGLGTYVINYADFAMNSGNDNLCGVLTVYIIGKSGVNSNNRIGVVVFDVLKWVGSLTQYNLIRSTRRNIGTFEITNSGNSLFITTLIDCRVCWRYDGAI